MESNNIFQQSTVQTREKVLCKLSISSENKEGLKVLCRQTALEPGERWLDHPVRNEQLKGEDIGTLLRKAPIESNKDCNVLKKPW